MTGYPRSVVTSAAALLLLLQLSSICAAGAQPEPGGERATHRLNIGPLRVGSVAEVGATLFIDVTEQESEFSARVVPPPSIKVNGLRVREREIRGQPKRLVELGLSLDTSREGELSDRVRLECGAQRVDVLVQAKVLPPGPDSTKILVICPDFGNAAEDPEYYRPWFDLIEQAHLDVSYIDPSRNGLPVDSDRMDRQGLPVLPDWFKAFDVILLVDGGPAFVGSGFDALILQSYVRGGGRLVVGASHSISGTVPNANRILRPFGLEIGESEAFGERPPRNKGEAPGLRVFHCRVDRDALTARVEDVSFYRATTVTIADRSRGRLLLRDPMYPGQGFAAVARDGGEVIAIGSNGLFEWAGGLGDIGDNALLLRNLVTKAGPRADKGD